MGPIILRDVSEVFSAVILKLPFKIAQQVMDNGRIYVLYSKDCPLPYSALGTVSLKLIDNRQLLPSPWNDKVSQNSQYGIDKIIKVTSHFPITKVGGGLCPREYVLLKNLCAKCNVISLYLTGQFFISYLLVVKVRVWGCY